MNEESEGVVEVRGVGQKRLQVIQSHPLPQRVECVRLCERWRKELFFRITDKKRNMKIMVGDRDGESENEREYILQSLEVGGDGRKEGSVENTQKK